MIRFPCRFSLLTISRRSLSQKERASYTTAVQCLIKKRSQANKRKVPGARNRLDDFVASHLIEGDKIHFNGHLFAWHRHFVWLYEQALRKECGYKGAQPYWDWTLDSSNLLASPLFDGSPYSMGSNGEFFPHGSTHLEAFGLKLDLPAGTGGGCLKAGPFKDLTVSILRPLMYFRASTLMRHAGQLGANSDPQSSSWKRDGSDSQDT